MIKGIHTRCIFWEGYLKISQWAAFWTDKLLVTKQLGPNKDQKAHTCGPEKGVSLLE